MQRKENDEKFVPVVIEGKELRQPEEAEGKQKRTLREHWHSFKAHLPKVQDPEQKKSGRNIALFIVAMFVLTLVARGTAGATLAVVKTKTAGSAEIIEAVTGDGAVRASSSNAIEIPAGIVPKDVLVSVGENVKEGDLLARFKPEEIDEQVARQQNQLKELNFKLKKLLQPVPTDNNTLTTAQHSKNNAQQDLNDTKAEGDAKITAAQNLLNEATAAAQAAADAYAALPEDTPEEARAAAKEALDDANAKRDEANAGLQAAKGEAEKNVKTANRALEQANQTLAGEEKTNEMKKTEASNQAEQNKIDAEATRLDIAKKQKTLDMLTQIQADNGELKATKVGTVTEVKQEGATAENGSTTVLVRLADTAGGYEAEVVVNKKDAEKVAVGSEAEAMVNSGSMFGSSIAKGRVLAVAPPDENGKSKVTIKLEGKEWKLGQSVQVRIVQKRQTYQNCVPISAVHTSNTGSYVLVVRKTSTILGTEIILEQVAVTLAAQDKSMAALEGGLGYDDEIVTDSSKPVKAGDRVRIGT